MKTEIKIKTTPYYVEALCTEQFTGVKNDGAWCELSLYEDRNYICFKGYELVDGRNPVERIYILSGCHLIVLLNSIEPTNYFKVKSKCKDWIIKLRVDNYNKNLTDTPTDNKITILYK